jgi:hypothetical protein
MLNVRIGRGCVGLVSLVLLMWSGNSALAQTSPYDFGIDVPMTIGTQTFSQEAILHRFGTTYSLTLALPSGTSVGALEHLTNGQWLLSPLYPATIQGTTYQPQDVIAYDGTTFSMYLQGAVIGIPSTARIDALFVTSSGDDIMSFDSVVNLGGADYGPSDLVRYNNGFSLYWSGGAAGVPAYANMIGAGVDGLGALVVSFDVPVNLGGVDYVPGQLVKWTGTGFVSYGLDSQWPPSVQLRDFAFPIGSCANTACNDTCWADGTHPNAGTFAKKTLTSPPECADLLSTNGCVNMPCN